MKVSNLLTIHWFPTWILLSLLSACTSQRPATNRAVSDQELASISNQLHAGDVNRAQSLSLNLQNRTRPGDRNDRASLPLFEDVPKEILTRPTYSTLLALFDNYAAAVEAPEVVTNQELFEENAFLEAILRTSVMKATHRFLSQKGLTSSDTSRFKETMKSLWFGMYSRAPGSQGSSGFEHVFLGEEKNGISGLHSWLRYQAQEAAGAINYLGYIKTLSVGNNVLMELPMKWNGVYKPVSSMSIGGSPELEIALYTICFMARPNELCPVRGNGTDYKIQTFSSNFKGKSFIGSTFPTF